MIIHKSQFLKGLNCTRYLYLDLFHKELADPQDTANSVLPSFGADVENVVYRQYFDGVNVYDPLKTTEELARITLDAMKKGVPVIYQPTFLSKDKKFAFRGDLLVKGEKKYRLLEVKSSTKIKLPGHIMDVGFQMMVLESHHTNSDETENGNYQYKSRKIKDALHGDIDISLIYLNNCYVFDGKLNLEGLLIEENVTARAKKNVPLIKRSIRTVETYIKKSKIPELSVGKHCHSPIKCPFFKYCWKEIPAKSLHRATTLSEMKIKKLSDLGITSIDDIPANFSISETARIQIAAELGRMETIKIHKLKNFFKAVEDVPLLFLDFESIMAPIPVFIGTKPYQQICFQYCIIETDSILGDIKSRKEFLAEPGYDPRREFIESLIQDTTGFSKVVVYNSGFEVTRLKELAVEFPEHRVSIENLIGRIIDLMVPFRERHYYHRKFEGSYSIKKVAPVLCPEISYDILDIQNGTAAMQAYSRMHLLGLEEKHNIRKALLEYCYTDVLSMFHIMRNLYAKIK